MIKVEVLNSNLEGVTDELLKELMPFNVFNQLSLEMDEGEFVKFILHDNQGEAFYQGTYQTCSWSVFEDIKKSLNVLLKEGKVDKKQKVHVINLLSQALGNEITEEEHVPESIPKEKKKRKKINFSKKGATIIVAFFVFIVLIVGGFKIVQLTQNKNESLEQLLQQKEFEKAYEQYPKETKNIVQYLYTNQLKEELAVFNKNHSTNEGLLKQYFLENKWEKVIAMKKIPVNKENQLILAYSYLKLNKIEEAELINEELKNSTLTLKIKEYQRRQAYSSIKNGDIDKAEQINKQLKDSAVSNDLSVAKSIVNLLSKYERDMTNESLSQQERDEAKENYDTWKNNLKQVGEE